MGKFHTEYTGQRFDGIMMDAPWKLASARETGGVASKYERVNDRGIMNGHIKGLQSSGDVWMWVSKAK